MRILILPLFCLCLALSSGPDAHADVRRFRCMFSADPATTMTVGFEQYNSSLNPFAETGDAVLYYDTNPHGNDASQYAFSQGVARAMDFKGMDNQFVRLVGLTPDTRYYFFIQDDQGESPVFFFETLSDQPTVRLSIIAGGDSRDIPVLDDDIGRQNANRMVAKLRADVVLFGGDMTMTDDATHPVDLNEWPEWMDDWQLSIATDGRMTPLIVARGNHELSNNSIYHFFDVPNPEVYYAITMGGGLLQTLTLNSEISRLGNQLTWLDDELSSTCATWKIVQYHRPTRPHESDKSEQDDQANAWSPLFEAHGVQLVVECDAHLCKYTQPIIRDDGAGSSEGFLRDDDHGVVYIGEGGWGAELRTADDNKPWTLASSSFNQIKWIFVDQQKMEVRTILTDNADAVPPKNDADDRFSIPNNMELWLPTPNDAPSGLLDYANGVLTLNNPTQPIVDLGPDVEVVEGTEVPLDAGGSYDSYAWSNGATTPSIIVTEAGTYTVTITENHCIVTDEVTVNTYTTSLSQLDSRDYQMQVSPNPAGHHISAFISSTQETEMQLRIISLGGQWLQEKDIRVPVGESRHTFSLQGMSHGVYLMVLEKEGRFLVQRFVING